MCPHTYDSTHYLVHRYTFSSKNPYYILGGEAGGGHFWVKLFANTIPLCCRVEYGNKGVGVVSQELYSSLTSLQMGLAQDTMGWTVQLE